MGAPLFRSLVVAAAATAALALASPSCRADDAPSISDPTPAPTPVVFSSPQYLVWMESHGTTSGTVVDRTYWLYTRPDTGGYFRVPDGDGGTFTYAGQVVSGPYADDSALCPDMLARGIRSLSSWPPGQYAAFVDCARFRPADGGSGVDGANTGSTPGTGGLLGGLFVPFGLAGAIAAGLGGVLLLGSRASAGTALVATTGPAAPPASSEPSFPAPRTDPPAAREDPGSQTPADPCGPLDLALRGLLDGARTVQRALEMQRSTVAALDQQIDRIANLTIPAGVVMDTGFVLLSLAGAQPGAAAADYAGSSLVKAAIKGALKDLLKSAIKGGIELYGEGDFARLADLANRGEQAALRGELKELLTRALMNEQLGAGTSLRPPVTSAVSPHGAPYRAAIDRLAEAQAAAKPVAEALTSVFSLVNTTMGTRDQMAALETLRGARSTLLDQVADQEVRLDSILEKARDARERLNFCRQINSPGWRA
jgi:hypothetical protein